jgi:hypothetical protein
MKFPIARVVAVFCLLVLSLTSLTLAQTSAQTASAPAAESTSSSATPSAEAISPPITGTGTTDFVPLWTNSTTLGNSVLFQSGTGSTAKTGVNTTTPAVTLDVNGAENVGGMLTLVMTGTATSTAGKNSEPLGFTASVFNSSTATATPQKFVLQAEPVGNDTASPAASLNLLYSSNNATPAETGLKISNKGIITFASGQTFGGGTFCIATGGGFGNGGTTFVGPSFAVPAANKCTPWSGFTKTASTVILTTSGAACLSTTGKTLTLNVSSADPAFLGTNPAADYIQLTRPSSTGTFTGGTDQGEFSGSADQITCTSSLLTLPDAHD